MGATGVQFRGCGSSGSSDGGSEGAVAAVRAQARGYGVYRGAGRSHKHSRGAGRGYRGETGNLGTQLGITEEQWGPQGLWGSSRNYEGSGGTGWGCERVMGAIKALGVQAGAVVEQ